MNSGAQIQVHSKPAIWVTLAAMMLTIFAPIFGGIALWHNYVFLASYAQDGALTSATLVELKEDNMQRHISLDGWFDHTPPGSREPYRNWVNGGYLNKLTIHPGEAEWQHPADPLEVGEQVEIIYLPGQPRGEAILPQDLDPQHMPLFRTPIAGWSWIGLWIVSIMLAIFLRRTPKV